MKPLYLFAAVLVVAASFFTPTPARAADTRTDCAQFAQNADHLDRVTSEIAEVGGRIDATGSQLASHMQGQSGTGVRSSLQRVTENIQAALHELHGALESVRASCQRYNPPNERALRPMDMGLRRSGEQHWNFAVIEAGSSQLHASLGQLAALTDEVRSARGDFGIHRERAVMRLADAMRAVTQLTHAVDDAASAMERTERCVSGMFSDDTKCNRRRFW